MTTWFRFYHEIIDDPKIGTLSEPEQLLWIKVLCLASMSGGDRGNIALTDEEICFRLRIESIEFWQSSKEKFLSKGLIQAEGDRISVTNWVRHTSHGDSGRLPIAEWRKVRAIVFARDNYTCQYCGATESSLHCDHVIPVSRGGSNEIENLVTACESCNLSKHNKTLSDWLGGEV